MLYAAVAATTNDAAHLDIMESKTLCGVDFEVHTTSGSLAANDMVQYQLSFNSTYQATNDANGVIANVASNTNFTTSGAVCPAQNKWCGPMAIGVRTGDRIYLHAVEGGGSSWLCQCVLHFK